MKFLLDTNVCIDYLNASHPSVVERLREASPEDLCLSSVAVAELRYGADKSARKKRNHEKLDVLTAEIQCVDFDLDAASTFGRVRAALEAQGTPVGPYDMMIGAHALALGCVLVTDNVQEFRRISGLEVENWRLPPAPAPPT
jgi:tRNA(fMet)-specific endonuclease VapC